MEATLLHSARAVIDPSKRPAIELAPGKWLGEGRPCWIVAEIGQNHNGDICLARTLIDQAALCQADAVKFCKRHVASDLTRAAHRRPYRGQHSFGATYGEHREFLELSSEQYAELQQRASSQGLLFFATACDRQSVDDLESIDVPFYKVASRDLANLPLLDYLAQTGKPIVLSCGMDSLAEIDEALETIRRRHNRVVLLQCTSAYPTAYEDIHLRVLPELRRRFEVLVGFSDHSQGHVAALGAVALGAVMLEKHVTLDRGMKGTDHASSLDIAGLHDLVREVRQLELAMGQSKKCVPPSVVPAQRRLGRSLVSRQRIPPGRRLTEDMLCIKSGGSGLKWRERGRILGRIARREIPADVVLSERDFL